MKSMGPPRQRDQSSWTLNIVPVLCLLHDQLAQKIVDELRGHRGDPGVVWEAVNLGDHDSVGGYGDIKAKVLQMLDILCDLFHYGEYVLPMGNRTNNRCSGIWVRGKRREPARAEGESSSKATCVPVNFGDEPP